MNIAFNLNGKDVVIEADGDMSLFWTLHDVLKMRGTKYGCGKGACGACTILIDDEPVRSCIFPAKRAEGRKILTIEGISVNGKLHPVQQAWLDEVVIQCGYCQPGFMLAAVALLNKVPNPSDEDIDRQILNICRCGTYYRIRKAIHRAAALINAPEEIVQHGKEK